MLWVCVLFKAQLNPGGRPAESLVFNVHEWDSLN